MILASIAEDDETRLGHWSFRALPNIGSHIVPGGDRYTVADIQHRPITAPIQQLDARLDTTVL